MNIKYAGTRWELEELSPDIWFLGIYGFNGSAVIRRMIYGFKVKMFPFKSIEDLRDIDPYLLNDEVMYSNISFESLKTIIISELEKYNANFLKENDMEINFKTLHEHIILLKSEGWKSEWVDDKRLVIGKPRKRGSAIATLLSDGYFKVVYLDKLTYEEAVQVALAETTNVMYFPNSPGWELLVIKDIKESCKKK